MSRIFYLPFSGLLMLDACIADPLGIPVISEMVRHDDPQDLFL